MKFLMTFLMLTVSAGAVFANNFYQTTNPFQSKTNSPEFNNIYATEVQAEAKEEYTKKKMEAGKRKNKSKKAVNEEVTNLNEGIKGTSDGSFYVFSK